jgi:RND family efflux transporter MFP subunit
MNVINPPRKSRYVQFRISLGIVAALFAATVGCKEAPKAKKSKTVEVVVAKPVVGELTDYQDFTGRMDALKTVDIRPRVSGYITEAPFVEGDLVKEGDLLFQIDPRPYEAELNQAKANLKLAQADVALQRKRVDRGRKLIGSGGITAEDLDQLIAAHDKAVATVDAMKAALERAQLNLDFTHVKVPPLRDDEGRPLVGRISRRMVDPGNLVNADQTILTTLVSIDPMYAYFDVDERTYLELAELTGKQSNSWFSALQFPVLMRLSTEEDFKTRGYVNFLDNRLNSNTGTVRMRGVFANPNGIHKAGLFVRIRLPKGTPQKMLLVPDEAVLSDQGRKYIYVLRKSKDSSEEGTVAKYLAVKLGQSVGGLRAVLRNGEEKEEDDPKNPEQLKSYDKVIVSGMQRVRPNAVVEVKDEQAREAPKSALTEVLRENRTAVDSNKTSQKAPALKEMPRVRSQQSRQESKGRH